jgi:adenylate cyclase class 2
MSAGAGNNTSLEIEVKFLVDDLQAMHPRLQQAGANKVKERIFELNVRYDNAWEGLRRKGQLLRLRADDSVHLTFKGEAQDPGLSEAKVREELEVSLDDFEIMAAILERVGFEPFQVYEKYRETWQLDDVEVVLDELPFGFFVELEGPEAALPPTAERLGLRWQQRILDNYLFLMAQLKERRQLSFSDLTFDNFEGQEASVADIYGDRLQHL